MRSNAKLSLPLVLSLLASPLHAQDDAPLSAIDWMTDTMSAPVHVALPQTVEGVDEPGVANSVTTEPVTVMPLDQPLADAVGLLPSAATGFPADLWGPARPGDVARMIRTAPAFMLPAMRNLFYLILLAELDPPVSAGTSGQEVFLARIDKLFELGALHRAQALLARAGPASPEIFSRAVDTALIVGGEEEQCAHLRAAPALSHDLGLRIFCLARQGDWEAAALALETSHALGDLDPITDALLARFLDPDLFEGEPMPDRPSQVSPLLFRLFEAAGEPLPTATLPLAFAQADLRPTSGWKGRIAAAERLARSGAVDGNQLLGLYTERRAAASGGVWERVVAVQRLEAALTKGDNSAIAQALPPAWAAFGNAEIEVAMAEIYGARLARLDLSQAPRARTLARRMGLLSRDYEAVADAITPANAEEMLLVALARGDLSGVKGASPEQEAVIAGFQAKEVPTRLRSLTDEGRLGEAILRAMTLFSEGTRGNLTKLSDALAMMRAVGLENTARRAALQYLVLERRG